MLGEVRQTYFWLWRDHKNGPWGRSKRHTHPGEGPVSRTRVVGAGLPCGIKRLTWISGTGGSIAGGTRSCVAKWSTLSAVL